MQQILGPVLTVWAAALSLAAFGAMGLDKRAACRSRRRVPERRLFLLAALGGAAGGWAGMYVFRHKTRHWYFVAGMPALTAVWAAALWLAWGLPRPF